MNAERMDEINKAAKAFLEAAGLNQIVFMVEPSPGIDETYCGFVRVAGEKISPDRYAAYEALLSLLEHIAHTYGNSKGSVTRYPETFD
jgi:hypothetical protein